MGLLDWYRLFTWLCLATVAAIAVFVVASVLPRTRATVLGSLSGQGTALAAVVAGGAMAGSLYLSEGGGLTPCRLCWFQRCAMYPLAVMLVMAAFRRDRSVRPYAFVLAGVGAAISAWHVAVEWRPSLESTLGACALDAPCSARPLPLAFGFISIPAMALSAFVFVIVILLADRSTLFSTQTPEETS
jgi:hypothetical protein